MSKTARKLMFVGRTPEERRAARAGFAEMLAAVKRDKLHLRKYTTWAAYVYGEWGRSPQWANKLIRDHGLAEPTSTRLEYGEGLQIGRELARIQRTRCYRATHSSFAAFVRELHDRPVGWGYRRIAEYQARTLGL